MARTKKDTAQEKKQQVTSAESLPEPSEKRVLRTRKAPAPEPIPPPTASKRPRTVTSKTPAKTEPKPAAKRGKKATIKDEESTANAEEEPQTSLVEEVKEDNINHKTKGTSTKTAPTKVKASETKTPSRRGPKGKSEIEEPLPESKLSKKPAPARGRNAAKKPVKPVPEEHEESSEDEEVEEKHEVEKAPSPKKRGTATKKPTEVVSKTKSSKPSAKTTTTTTARGRKAKASETEDEIDNAQKSESEAPKEPPKTTGRGRKAVPKSEKKVEPEPPKEEVKAPTRRGRKAVVETVSEDKHVPDEPKVEKPKKEELKTVKESKTEPEAVPKTVRGRKGKTAVPEKIVEQNQPVDVETNEAAKETIKESKPNKSRGRKAAVPEEETSEKTDFSKVQKGRGKRAAAPVQEEVAPVNSIPVQPAASKPLNNVEETFIIRKAETLADETVSNEENLEIIETIEMLVNETVISQDSSFEQSFTENGHGGGDDGNQKKTQLLGGMKRKADESINDSLEVTKRLKIEDYSRILTVGSSPIAGELGPQQKLFNGQKIKPTMPRLIGYPGESGAVMIASGAFHNIFIDNDERMRSFGCNDDGSLGRDTVTIPEDYDGDEDEYEERACMIPGYVEAENLKFKKVAAGDMLSVGLDSKGDVYVFGNIKDESNKLGLFVDSPPLMAKEEDGTLYKTSSFESTKVPRKVDIGGEKAVDIAAGCHHVVILTSTGNVYTFGEGSKGQLGRIKVEDLEEIKTKRDLFLKPQVVTFKKLELSEKIAKVFAGQWSSYAVTSLGNLYGWGLNNYFQLGFETKTPVILKSQPDLPYCFELLPVKVPLDFKVTEVALGQQHLLLLDSDSNVHSCGNGHYGRLGLSKISSKQSVQDFKTPQLIERERFNDEAIQSIACGDFFSLALSNSGTVYAWGQASGAVGVTEDDDDLFRPTKFSGPVIDSYHIIQISAGSGFSAFIGDRK